MMKRSLVIAAMTLGLAGSAQAAGEFVNTDGAMDDITSGNFKLGGMYDSDYSIGAIMQVGHILDLKVGLDGTGLDFHVWKMRLKTNSAYLNRHPIEFYASAGVGYRWEDGGQGDGVILRAPGGADWQFTSSGWSCYLEVGPSYNFGKDNNDDMNGFRIMSGTGIRYNF